MINIDFEAKIFECPFCGCKQAYSRDCCNNLWAGYNRELSHRTDYERHHDVEIYHIKCNNKACGKITVVARGRDKDSQWDIIPKNVYRQYPEYIPQQIRDDYVEASSIINNSPKAAATLLRRCLQGMIHDFWNIHGKNLNAEITMLKEKVQQSQWNAIDGLRKIGNIGAHMEHDVNLVIDIDCGEAIKLQKLIELLLEKWYISRHEEELLYREICDISDKKQEERK